MEIYIYIYDLFIYRRGQIYNQLISVFFIIKKQKKNGSQKCMGKSVN